MYSVASHNPAILELSNFLYKASKLLIAHQSNKDEDTFVNKLLVNLVRKKYPDAYHTAVMFAGINPEIHKTKQDIWNLDTIWIYPFNEYREVKFGEVYLFYHNYDNYSDYPNFEDLSDETHDKGAYYFAGRLKSTGLDRTFLEELENSARLSYRYGVGNCGELASLAYVLACELTPKIITTINRVHSPGFGYPCDFSKVKINFVEYEVGEGDPESQYDYEPFEHGFLLINKEDSPSGAEHVIESWCTQGDTYIVDPWLECVINLHDELKNPPESQHPLIQRIKRLVARGPSKVLNLNEPAYVGQGHSKRWCEKATRGKRTNLLAAPELDSLFNRPLSSPLAL